MVLPFFPDEKCNKQQWRLQDVHFLSPIQQLNQGSDFMISIPAAVELRASQKSPLTLEHNTPISA